ncbi:30S ribosomal protein S21, chloroplastic-like [Punica granatum]|uniref:30S ribosomal protein S21, chloroplastic-like n=2 Tax=Punica granatum TaxID=22663 RepID=A0A6P8EM20_PUNGR|nr:30S ribosomal protein S21, chloroplastic-like [Punica granatum]PKI46513.1 hypothetical protein CRG98_033070 [Punica granatum]
MASLSTNFLSFMAPRSPPRLTLPPPSQLPRIRGCSAAFAAPDGLSLSSASLAVANPALAHSNTLFFSGYNVQVVVDDNEPEERLLNRFRREVMRAGVIQECKRRRFYENKQDEKKRKSREAAKRNRRRRSISRNFTPSKPEIPANKKNDDDEDNWDLPEDGAIPY